MAALTPPGAQKLAGELEVNVVIPDIFYTPIGNLAAQHPLNEYKLLADTNTIKGS